MKKRKKKKEKNKETHLDGAPEHLACGVDAPIARRGWRWQWSSCRGGVRPGGAIPQRHGVAEHYNLEKGRKKNIQDREKYQQNSKNICSNKEENKSTRKVPTEFKKYFVRTKKKTKVREK